MAEGCKLLYKASALLHMVTHPQKPRKLQILRVGFVQVWWDKQLGFLCFSSMTRWVGVENLEAWEVSVLSVTPETKVSWENWWMETGIACGVAELWLQALQHFVPPAQYQIGLNSSRVGVGNAVGGAYFVLDRDRWSQKHWGRWEAKGNLL